MAPHPHTQVVMIQIHDDAAVAVQDFAAGRRNGQGFDAVALGLLVVHLRVLDLQVPEAGDQKKEDEDAGVLENSDFARGEFDTFAAGLFALQRWLTIKFRTEYWRVHGGAWGFTLSVVSLSGSGATAAFVIAVEMGRTDSRKKHRSFDTMINLLVELPPPAYSKTRSVQRYFCTDPQTAPRLQHRH